MLYLNHIIVMLWLRKRQFTLGLGSIFLLYMDLLFTVIFLKIRKKNSVNQPESNIRNYENPRAPASFCLPC
jgi:hypothetical protein